MPVHSRVTTPSSFATGKTKRVPVTTPGSNVEEYFKIINYEGNGQNNDSVFTGMDLSDSGPGGLLMVKRLDLNAGENNVWADTVRGTDAGVLSPNTTAAPYTTDSVVTGFDDGAAWSKWTGGGGYTTNTNNGAYTSQILLRQPGFFDIVEYTGNGTTDYTINHNLDSVPGCIIIKSQVNVKDWMVYHVGLDNPNNMFFRMGQNTTKENGAKIYNATSTTFQVSDDVNLNVDGEKFIAYIFANDDKRFGYYKDQSIISCGKVQSNTGTKVTLGWEPQWVMCKPATASGGLGSHAMSAGFRICDVFQGIFSPKGDNGWYSWSSNNSQQQSSYGDILSLDGDGFTAGTHMKHTDQTSSHYNVYIAIRRPMSTVTKASEMFSNYTFTGDGSNDRRGSENLKFMAATSIYKDKNATGDWQVYTRQQGSVKYGGNAGNIQSSSYTYNSTESNAVVSELHGLKGMWESYNPVAISSVGTRYEYNQYGANWSSRTNDVINLARVPGGYDILYVLGDNVDGRVLKHNLQKPPEMMWVKTLNSDYDWRVYHQLLGNRGYMTLNSNAVGGSDGWLTNTDPTSTSIKVSNSLYTNYPDYRYIYHLFATVPGVTKVGSYTGTGNAINVPCGFDFGAQTTPGLVMIRRKDAVGDWYIWTQGTGINGIGSNDPFFLLNGDAALNSSYDYISPYSNGGNSGFRVEASGNAALNASGGQYIFWAINNQFA